MEDGSELANTPIIASDAAIRPSEIKGGVMELDVRENKPIQPVEPAATVDKVHSSIGEDINSGKYETKRIGGGRFRAAVFSVLTALGVAGAFGVGKAAVDISNNLNDNNKDSAVNSIPNDPSGRMQVEDARDVGKVTRAVDEFKANNGVVVTPPDSTKP